MKSPKISIITPVYNAEKYIHKCVDSIIAQTFTDWELILVDDGSPDSSGRICDVYADQDFRIRVIHKQNGGVSAARQTGLDAAQGEYVIHADPDDWIDSNMLEELYAKAKQTDADVVICDYYTNSGEKQTYNKQEPTSLESKKVLCDLFQQLHGSCCNKLARRVCYSRYCIRFPEGINYCEDLLTWVQFFKNEDVKIAYLPKAFYHYWQNPNSITNKLSRKNYEGLQRFLVMLEDILIGDEYAVLKEKAHLDVFVQAFIGDVLTNDELRTEFTKIKHIAYRSKSPRWKLGYIMISLGLYSIAHKLIRY